MWAVQGFAAQFVGSWALVPTRMDRLGMVMTVDLLATGMVFA